MVQRISADYLLDDGEAEAQKAEQDASTVRFESFLSRWRDHPADFVCEVLGAQPDSWQCDVMDALLEEDNVAVRACHGVGKAQPLSLVVDTPVGPREFGDLQVGDFVFGGDGRPVRVVGVFDQGVRDVYRVVFDDESSTLCCREHLWTVQGRSWRNHAASWETLPLEALEARGLKRPNGRGSARAWKIPVIGWDYPARWVPIHPYVLGAWLGDGSRKTALITNNDHEVSKRIQELGYDITNRAGRTAKNVWVHGLQGPLRRLGVLDCRAREKFVPREYLYTSREFREELLRGLLDTDGYVNVHGTTQFTSVSERLASNVVWLCRSLGGVARLHKKQQHVQNGKICESWTVTLTLPEGRWFYISRKQMRVRLTTQKRYGARWIDRIESAGRQAVRCIRVDAADGLYIANDGIVTHNTSLAAWVIIWYMFTHRHAVVPTTAPTYNKQVRDVLWGTGIHKWYERAQEINPWLTNFFELTTTRMHHVRHQATWFAVGIASGTPVNVEGYHSENLLAVFDEAKGIHKATWESIEGMRTTQQAKLLVMSTPGGKIGEFFKVFTEYKTTWPVNFVIHPECLKQELGRKEAKPYSKGGTYYSNRTRQVWVERMGLQWGKDSAAYIARCIGDFPDLADMNLIPYEWLSRARNRQEGIEGETWVSCDVARSGRDRTVILVGKGGTLLAGETISRNPEESTPLEARLAGVGKDPKRPFYRSTAVTAQICHRLARQYNAVGIVLDDGTFGGGVNDILRDILGERTYPVAFGSSPTDRPVDPEDRRHKAEKHLLDSHYVNIKAEMGWHMRGGFESNFIALGNLPGHLKEPLIEQCSLMEVDHDAHGRIKLVDPDEQEELPGVGEEVKRSPDHCHALMLLWWKTGPRRGMKPAFGTPDFLKNVTQLGSMPERSVVAGQASRLQGPRAGVGGQAAWIQRRYRV